MRAEVIALGDELVSGQRLDTNSRWLSMELEGLGIPVAFHTTVGDDLGAIVAVLKTAVERADIIVCTGGLGPTADDLTRDAMATVAARPLVLDEEVLDGIQRLFARRRRSMPERNRVQAMFPEGSRVIANPHGTAPGFELDVLRSEGTTCRIVALPGVPAEMTEMWRDDVAPSLLSLLGERHQVICRHVIQCFGIGESDLEQRLPDMIRRDREPRVGITASQATLTLRITATGDSEKACRELMEPTLTTIRQCLGSLIFSERDETLQDVVIRLLRAQSRTLATAEFDSGGLLAQWLSAADKAGKTYRGGHVFRECPERALANFGQGDGRVESLAGGQVDQLAAIGQTIRSLYDADVALIIGPFPPDERAADRPGDVTIVWLGNGWSGRKQVSFAGHPDMVTARTVKHALNCLRLELLEG